MLNRAAVLNGMLFDTALAEHRSRDQFPVRYLDHTAITTRAFQQPVLPTVILLAEIYIF